MIVNNDNMLAEHLVRTITIVGANGVMGTNAAGIFAAFGNATVFLVSRDIQKSRNAIEKAIQSVRSDAIRGNFVACDYSELAQCVSKSDLVFESVSEDFAVKAEITKRIGTMVADNTMIASGTSGLSLEQLSLSLPPHARRRYFGLHFFNPPYQMPLLEIIPTSSVDANLVASLAEYFKKVLFRKVVITKDQPAFLANRIGFALINHALQLAEKHQDKGGVDYIDYVLGGYTGRAMPPCLTANFVGLDTHKAICQNVYSSIPDQYQHFFAVPSFIQGLIAAGRLGVKTGVGLYRTEFDIEGKRTSLVYDIHDNSYRPLIPFSIPFVEDSKRMLREGRYQDFFALVRDDGSAEGRMVRDYIREYIEYSLYVVSQVGTRQVDVETAMTCGFNWAPPLSLSNALFGSCYETEYDYRRYFRAGRI